MASNRQTLYFGSAVPPALGSTPTGSFDEQWGFRVRKMRAIAGLRQEELAKKVGLERTSISNIEKGKQRLSLELAFKVTEACGFTLFDVEAFDRQVQAKVS